MNHILIIVYMETWRRPNDIGPQLSVSFRAKVRKCHISERMAAVGVTVGSRGICDPQR